MIIKREVIENTELSWAAKGLLAYLSTRDNNIELKFGDIVGMVNDGRPEYVGKLINELEKRGFINIERTTRMCKDGVRRSLFVFNIKN